MKDLKYCCEDFKFRVNLFNYQHPNIRIVKFTDSRYESGIGKFSFVITEGYEEKFSFRMVVVIKYCPFCGKKLSKFYKDDAYANEIEGVTFDY